MAIRHYVHFTYALDITFSCGSYIDIAGKVCWSLRKRMVSCNRVLMFSCIVSTRPRRKSWLVHFYAWTIDFDVLEIFSVLFCSLINLYILLLLHVLIIAAVNRANENEEYHDAQYDKANDLPDAELVSVITWVMWRWCWIVRGNCCIIYWGYTWS